MRAGSLNRRLTLLRPVAEKDKLGATVVAFVAVATVWASHLPIRDEERLRAAAVDATITDRFQIRRTSAVEAVAADWRLEFKGRPYEISGVKPVDGGQGLEITANALAAGGVP